MNSCTSPARERFGRPPLSAESMRLDDVQSAESGFLDEVVDARNTSPVDWQMLDCLVDALRGAAAGGPRRELRLRAGKRLAEA